MNPYFDNAATSWPKPELVYKAVDDCMRFMYGNPRRTASGPNVKLLFQTREAVTKLFNIRDSSRVVFTPNATLALNMAILGYIHEGDRVITSSMEHNAVTRPLNHLVRTRKIDLNIVRCSAEGFIDPDDFEKACKKKSRVAVINHASNVSGTVQPLETLSRIAHNHGIVFFADCSQSAGEINIDIEQNQIDVMACSGHKGLLAPSGTGILYLAPEIKLDPILFGGTGSFSELDEMPEQVPDRYEPGTMNFHGIAGLKAAIQFLFSRTIDSIAARKSEISDLMLQQLRQIDGLVIHGPGNKTYRTSVFSVTFPGIDPAALGNFLSQEFGITARIGLHCAPWAHQTLGTFPEGTLRLSPGFFHTDEDILFLSNAVKQAIRELQRHA